MNQPLAYIHPNARIAEDVKIEPFAWIGEDVEIGSGTWIGPNATIMDGARIGKDCQIFPGAVVSAIPQDLKFEGEESRVEIGDRVNIRECATINRGTAASGRMVTRVGSDTLIMSYAHIAHDCIVGDHCIIVSYTGLAGETDLADWVTVGGKSMAHQFTKIGAHAFVAANSKLVKDIPPYVLVGREPVVFEGVNRVGLLRRGFTEEQVNLIKELYDTIYFKGMNVSQALDFIEANYPASDIRDTIVNFIRASKRGIVSKPRPAR